MTAPHDSTGIDALVRAIEALQERIRNDGDTIGSNEIRTRTALVDPLLTALGWDTTDPAMVIPEYAAGGGTADYALLKVTPDDGSPVIAFIEAKRLHEPLEPHRAQMLTYANMSGVKYAGLTNGDRWELYEVFKEAPLHERRLVDVSLRREPVIDCAAKLLLLQATNLQRGMGLSTTGAQTLLDRAIETRASPAVVELLLDRGADIARRDSAGWTPLHHAVARNARQSVIELLLQRGADTTAADSRGWTPLHQAVASIGRCVAPGCGRILHPQERVCKPDEGGCGMVQFTTCIQCWRDTRLNHIEPGGLCVVCARSGEADPLAVIAMLLDHGADIEAADNDGMTPLHHASEPSVIGLLLDRGANIEAIDNSGQTPLHHATEPLVAALLLDRGAGIEVTDTHGSTPLHLAIRSHSEQALVKELLDRGAYITARNAHGWTPLHFAAAGKEVTLTHLLIEQGADIEAQTDTGATPLHIAAKPNQLVANFDTGAAMLLLDSGADIAARDESGATPLHWAAEHGRDFIELLLNRGADVEAATKNGVTPLHSAATSNTDLDMIRLLIKHGADVTVTTIDGTTPLHCAAVGNSNPSVIELLLDCGANLEAVDRFAWRSGWTPLHCALRLNSVTIIALLLERGADITARDFNAATPLHQAALRSKAYGAELLLVRSADIAAVDNRGATPLHYAASANASQRLVELLINRGADVLAKDSQGFTPLHTAASTARIHDNRNPYSVIAALLDRGADPAARTNDGGTPYEIAEARGASEEVLRLLHV